MKIFGYSEKNAIFPLSAIKAMEIAASKIPGVISLAQGIPSFSMPEEIRAFTIDRINQGLCDKYSLTNGLPELREEISLSLQKDGLSYDPDREIIVTVGSIEAISSTLLALLSPGDEVLIPSPTYASYYNCIMMAGCVPKYIPLNEEDNFDFEIDQFSEKISKKTRAILYASPNNPTGTLFSEKKTCELVQLATKHNIILIIDEVYKDFYYTDDKHFTPASIPEIRDRVVRVCSFSKAFAMTGWRVGFLHSDSRLTSRILGYHDSMVTCAPVASQYAAIGALKFGDPYISKFREEFKRRRDITIAYLDKLSHLIDYQTPKAAYFAFPRIKDTVQFARDSNKLAYDILEKSHVALVPGIAFGPTGESHLRITFGRDIGDLEEGLKRLTSYLTSPKERVLSTTYKITPSKKKRAGWFRNITHSAMQFCAKAYLKFKKPKIIGIIGTTGKTVFKRIILNMISNDFTARANILSYNTPIGISLSILDIPSPRNNTEKFALPWKVLQRFISNKQTTEVLVLEYGILSEQDAKDLLRIALPDWIVITDLTSPDPSLDQDSILSGLLSVLQHLPPERVIWPSNEFTIQLSNIKLDKNLAYHEAQIVNGIFKYDGTEYKIATDMVGHSAKLAVGAAMVLAKQMKISTSSLNSWLNKVGRD